MRRFRPSSPIPSECLGEAAFRTPRTAIKAFMGLLAVLEQNPGADWRVLLNQTEVEADQPTADAEIGNELTSLVP